MSSTVGSRQTKGGHVRRGIGCSDEEVFDVWCKGFNGSALRGHDELDVFSWGLMYRAFLKPYFGSMPRIGGHYLAISVLWWIIASLSSVVVADDVLGWLVPLGNVIASVVLVELLYLWMVKRQHDKCRLVGGTCGTAGEGKVRIRSGVRCGSWQGLWIDTGSVFVSTR